MWIFKTSAEELQHNGTFRVVIWKMALCKCVIILDILTPHTRPTTMYYYYHHSSHWRHQQQSWLKRARSQPKIHGHTCIRYVFLHHYFLNLLKCRQSFLIVCSIGHHFIINSVNWGLFSTIYDRSKKFILLLQDLDIFINPWDYS